MIRPDPLLGGIDARGTVPRATLEELSRTGSEHLRPLYAAMLNPGVSLLMVHQRGGRFGIEGTGGFVALIGDDTDCALGPRGFHRKSIRRLARQVRSMVIVASGVEPRAYAGVAALASVGFGALLVETRPEQEGAWLDTLRAAAPRTPILLVTPIAGNA